MQRMTIAERSALPGDASAWRAATPSGMALTPGFTGNGAVPRPWRVRIT